MKSKSDVRRLWLALLCLVAPGAALGYRVTVFEPARTHVDLEAVPERIGAHQLQREDLLEPEALAMIRPVQYVMRLYDDGEVPVWLYAGYYGDRLGIGAHEPSVCYPALGWEVLWSRNVSIPVEDGHSLHARLLMAERDGRRELVLYWFQPRSRWPYRPWLEELAKIRDAILGRPEYTFVRLSSAFLPGEPEPDLAPLVRDFAPAVRAAMGGKSPRSDRR